MLCVTRANPVLQLASPYQRILAILSVKRRWRYYRVTANILTCLAGKSFAYRRAAQMRAEKAVEDNSGLVDGIYAKASSDFQTFCTLLDKPPAPHMLMWYEYLITGESNKYLMDIAGPNLDILAPRGSAKSTVPKLIHCLDHWAGTPRQVSHCRSFM